MASPAKDPLLGRTIGQRYRLISRLGAGSVASVYLARHVLIERLGAIKIVHPELAKDQIWRERFLREARAVNRINHPNIVEITDLGEADGLLFLVMEYVPGESLKTVLERGLGHEGAPCRGPLGWRRAAAVGLQVASALGRAHQMEVVHRALDPSNVLLVTRRDGADAVKLIDFGFAKLSDAAPLTERIVSLPSVENLHDLDARSDLRSLGEILYEATCGTPPRRPADRLSSHAPDTPAFFDEVVATLLAPNPDDRPRDGFEAFDLLRRALEREQAPVPVLSPSVPPASERASWWPLLDQAGRPSVPPASISEPPSAGDSPRSSNAGDTPAPPGIGATAIDRLSSICGAALATLEDRIELLDREIDDETRAALGEARRLCTTVAVLSELVGSDTRALEAVQARGRSARADLGRRLDEAARDHSKTLGWAGTIAERSYQVEVQRLSGEHPVPAIEAMVWEQAALEQEEDLAREKAARLDADMRACQAEIERHSERLDHEIRVVNACLEGRIGALRAISIEAWAALEAAAVRAGVPPSELRTSGHVGEQAR